MVAEVYHLSTSEPIRAYGTIFGQHFGTSPFIPFIRRSAEAMQADGYNADVQIPGAFAAMFVLGTGFLFSAGALFLLRLTYSLLRLLLELTIMPGTNVGSPNPSSIPLTRAQIERFKSRAGSTWAMVTGATGGIGLEFARQLASKGFNIMLLGRRSEALDEIAKDISQSVNGSETALMTCRCQVQRSGEVYHGRREPSGVES